MVDCWYSGVVLVEGIGVWEVGEVEEEEGDDEGGRDWGGVDGGGKDESVVAWESKVAETSEDEVELPELILEEGGKYGNISSLKTTWQNT